MVMTVAKTAYFATAIASARSWPAGLFWLAMATGLLQLNPIGTEEINFVAWCDEFATYFTGKINGICLEFDSGLIIGAELGGAGVSNLFGFVG